MQSLQGNILFVLCYLCCISGNDTLSDRQHLKFIALMFYSKLWGGEMLFILKLTVKYSGNICLSDEDLS